ncbi:MAG: cytochrome c oxidase subunit 3 [Sphingomonadales bacterium]|nr:cytochrome c oxidase subunit 3 [Sphingomonadales bacterium]
MLEHGYSPKTDDGKPGNMQKSKVPGEPGIWVLILGEMSVFAVMFVSFLLARSGEVAQFHLSCQQLDRGSAVLNTIVLLTSSLFVAMGVRAARERSTLVARRLFLAGAALGFAFVTVKSHEYYVLLERGVTLSTNMFFSYYFGLTILHLIHVAAGVVILLLLGWRLELLSSKLAIVESAGCWWHMVDLLWVIIFPLLYLVE